METSPPQSPDGDQAGADDPLKKWLGDTGRIPANKTRQHSKRLAMEQAVARFREIAKRGSAEELKEAYIHLIIGRGLDSSASDKSKDKGKNDTSST